jgi:hypothetical protein
MPRVEFWAYNQAAESSSSFRTDKDGIASFLVDANMARTPGILVAQAWVLRPNALPLGASIDISCVGVPAFISLTAQPNVVVAGETAIVHASIEDILMQKVWDGTKLELKSSTGRMTSGLVESLGGVATDFLMTNVPGPCTIVATVKNGFGGAPLTHQLRVEVLPPDSSIN